LHERAFPIDTTIRRVGDRLLLGIPFPDPKKDERLRKAGEAFLPIRGRFFDVPQALFDLATAICTKNPSCAICPMRADCPAAKKFLSGRVRIPKAMIQKTIESRHRGKKYPDRIYRGRILKLVRESKNGVAIKTIGSTIDATFDAEHDDAWMLRMLDRMERDGMIIKINTQVILA
jgi:adenine-specific DNA glycosylase